MYLLSMPVYVCFEMVTSYLQSIGRRRDANSISFLGQTLLYLPLVAWLGLRFGAVGVLLSSPLAMLITLAIFYGKVSWKQRRPAGLREILHVSGHTREKELVITIGVYECKITAVSCCSCRTC